MSETAAEKVVLRDADGNVTEEAFLKDGALEGEVLLYSAGRLRGRLLYRAGKQNGPAVYYWETGLVAVEANYADGNLEGESRYFDEQRRLVRRALYEKGRLQGRTIDYYASGQARTVSHYRDNVLHGEVWQYGEDGKLRERSCFHEGKPYPCREPARRANPVHGHTK
jgi:antitoxin component YwqK of YwqJK toxin-antitoxin module